MTSFPGLGDLTGARVLGEIGDDRARSADARRLKAYAGSAPVTRASGRSISITRRIVKNDRLAAAGFIWAFMAMTNSPFARAHYDRCKATGNAHPAALRHLFNRMLGQLYHCLQTGQTRVPNAVALRLPIRRSAFPVPWHSPIDDLRQALMLTMSGIRFFRCPALRITQEEAFPGRCVDVGDELG